MQFPTLRCPLLWVQFMKAVTSSKGNRSKQTVRQDNLIKRGDEVQFFGMSPMAAAIHTKISTPVTGQAPLEVDDQKWPTSCK